MHIICMRSPRDHHRDLALGAEMETGTCSVDE
jgi:hypothetical protein